MSTRTAVFAALLTSIAVTFVFTGSAFAGWFIEGEELTSSAALATTAAVDEAFVLLVPNVEDLKIECSGTNLDATGPIILASRTLRSTSLSFLSCNTTKPASGCALEAKNQTISTLPLAALVTEGPKSPEDRLVFTPQTKTTLAEIKFSEANTCAFSSIEPLKGAIKLKAPTLQEELTNQPVEGLGSIENNSLEVGIGSKAYLTNGKALLQLAAGLGFAAQVGAQPTIKIIAPDPEPLQIESKRIGDVIYEVEAGGPPWRPLKPKLVNTKNGFTIFSNKCTGVIAAGTQCTIEVAFVGVPGETNELKIKPAAPAVDLESVL